MNLLGIVRIASLVTREDFGIDSDGHVTTHSAIWPERAEIIYGGFASIVIFAMLIKFAGPAIKKGLAARTERIQKELDDAAADKAAAAEEATVIRTAKGDIAAERERLLADADAQAAAIVEDGRARLDAELDDLEARAVTDIAAVGGRVNDELRAEIARLSIAAVDHVVSGTLDDATQQSLIEDFISRVGAGAHA
jgi:F-type H+-transporting ATPase subunit b